MEQVSKVQGGWIGTWAIALIGLTAATADQALFAYAMPDIAKTFGLETVTLGWVVSLSFGLAVIGVTLSGMLTDRIGRKWSFTLLLVASALCVGLHSIAQNFTQLAILRILGFAISAGLYPVTSTLVLEAAPDRLRGLASGSLQIAYPIGFFLSASFAAPLLEHGGWRTLFLIAFVVAPIGLILGLLLKEPDTFVQASNRASSRPDGRKGIRALLAPNLLRITIICVVGTFLINLAISAFIYFVPTYLVEARGFSSPDAARLAGTAFGIGAIGYVLAALVGEFVLSRRNTFVIWCCIGALAINWAMWGATTDLLLLAGLGFAVMFLFGSEAVRMPLIGELYPTSVRATGTAVGGSVGVALGSFVSPVLLTSVQSETGWEMAFTLVGVIPIIIGALTFLLLPSPRRGQLAEVPANAR